MVIVLEDDKLSAWALSKVLEDAGYKPVIAETGEAVVRKVEDSSAKPVAIISDYHLGSGMNGVEAAKEVAELSGGEIPTIVTSHRENEEAEKHARSEGFMFYAKPMDPERMLGLLDRMVSDR